MLLKFLCGNLSDVHYALIIDLFMLIEKHQHKHLVAGRKKLVLLMEVAPELGRSKTELPVDLSPVVELAEVELRKGSHRVGDLLWERD